MHSFVYCNFSITDLSLCFIAIVLDYLDEKERNV